MTKNINLISLILYLLAIFAQIVGGIIFLILGALIKLLLFPIIICLAIYDIIKNPNSNTFNLVCLLLVAYLIELSYNSPVIISPFYINADIFLYFLWLIFFLIILALFNNLKGNKIFKYSTLLILSFTLIFHHVIKPYWVGTLKLTKNVITKKVGGRNKYCNIRTKECVETKIPRIYDSLEVLFSSLPEPIFRASKGNKHIIINRLNENIVPDADDIEYIGSAYTNTYHLFKVLKNKKYGIYRFAKYGSQKLHGERIIIPIIYDEIEIIKDTDRISTIEGLSEKEQKEYENSREKEAQILGIIAKKSDLYDLYVETLTSKASHHGMSEKLDFKLRYSNKKDIKYLGKIQYDDYKDAKRHIKFKIDDKYSIFSIYGHNTLKTYGPTDDLYK